MSTPEPTLRGAHDRRIGSQPTLLVAATAAALVAALLRPGHAGAQSSPRGGDTTAPGVEQEARAHFEMGLQRYGRRDFEGALREFQQSYRLRAVPIVLINIGQSQRQLRRYADAIASYEEFLTLADTTIAPERRATVIATIEELRRSVGTVTVESDPPGAQLVVDGASVGTTPRRGLMLAAGTHVFELSAEGAVPVREEVTVVARRDRLVRFALPARFRAAELSVSSPQAGAVVVIDGNEVGPAPVTRQLNSGTHRIEVRAPGFESRVSEVELDERQHRTLRVVLTAGGGIATRWYFWAAIGVVVTGAVVAGVLIGTQGEPPPNCGTNGCITIRP